MERDYKFFCPKGKRIFNSLLEVKMCSCSNIHKNCPNNIAHSYKEGMICEYLDGNTPRDIAINLRPNADDLSNDGEES